MASDWHIIKVDLDGDAWQQLLDAEPHSMFDTATWGRVLADGLGAEPAGWIVQQGTNPVCGLAGFTKRSLWARLFFANIPYGGLVGEVPDALPLASLFAAHAKTAGLTRVRLTDYPDRPLPTDGFHCHDSSTHVLELGGRTWDELWQGFKRNIRRDIRIAEKKGVTAVWCSDEDGYRAFYQLYLDSMRRNSAIPKYGWAFIDALRRHIGDGGHGGLFLAMKDDRAVAGVMVVDSGDTSFYLMGGSTSADLKYCPNDLLIGEAIKRAASIGKSRFDFLPSGPGDTALMQFKAKWGAREVPLRTLDLTAQPLRLALWQAAYRIAESAAVRPILQAWQTHRSNSRNS